MKLKSLIITAFALFGLSLNSNAQSFKIAHINSQELMDTLPEADTIQMKLEAIQGQYLKILQNLRDQIEQTQNEINNTPKNDIATLEILNRSLNDLYGRYNDKESEAQNYIAQKQEELLQPLIDKLKKTIQEVAKEKGYAYVLDSSVGGGVIYSDPAHDLMPAVKAKLGIK
ncbi:MAG: OmpH family outer membrane protein [Flavobacteriales bacterium]|nr:OmpH family outer membrane protein [Flavobacteriales bacterium]